MGGSRPPRAEFFVVDANLRPLQKDSLLPPTFCCGYGLLRKVFIPLPINTDFILKIKVVLLTTNLRSLMDQTLLQ